MFETVLVAARGPLAVRVVRTCQRLGVRAVAVHGEADGDALHVREADEAVLLGPASPEDSYLDHRRVLEAARQSGASAVHPGAGALAADAAFARAVRDAGLGWVGAAPEVLDRLAPPAPVPDGARCLSVHLLADDGAAALAVLDVTPVGGQVHTASAPPLDVPDLAAVSETAARATVEAGVRGVAGAEVLLQPDGAVRLHALRPWLPVEHPVSELLTGHDLVEQQLRLAHGGAAQPPTTPPLGEHALLLRVYAEPDPGTRRLTVWREPAGVRVDSGCREGDAVLPWYDPLLATVTVSGPTREDVRGRARTAVGELEVEGLRTTLPLLAALLADPSSDAA